MGEGAGHPILQGAAGNSATLEGVEARLIFSSQSFLFSLSLGEKIDLKIFFYPNAWALQQTITEKESSVVLGDKNIEYTYVHSQQVDVFILTLQL